MWGSFDFDFVYQNSVGKGGGLVSIWNKDLFQKNGEIIQRDCIIVNGMWKENDKPICFINVYASQNPSTRADLWNTILSFLNNWDGLTIMCGDFNDVRNRTREGDPILTKELPQSSTNLFMLYT